jgi:phospholipase A1
MSNWQRAAVVCTFLIAGATSALSAQTILLTPPADPVQAGSETTILAYYLNDGGEPVKVDAPAELKARAAWAGGNADVTLVRDADAEAADVQPGAFLRVEYRFVVPQAAPGAMTLALAGGGAAVVNVGEVKAIATPATTAATKPAVIAPVVPVRTPSSRDGAEPEFAAPYLGTLPPTPSTTPEGFVEYFAKHFSAYEPVYFLVGNEKPNAKFQISFKYQLFNELASVVKTVPPLGGLHIGYSQTSFWDLKSDSKPFFDNSYRPELMLSYADLLPGLADEDDIGILRQLGLQISLQHESNGRDGSESRSINYFYVRPNFTFGDAARDPRGLFLSVAPRFHVYLDKEDNPDINDYRGYGDLRLTTGWRTGLQLAAIGRIGADGDKGSLELDLTYPLSALLQSNIDAFLHAQLFTGYGESLLEYNESDTTFRLGFSFIR